MPVLKSSLLADLPWLEHGFGTKDSEGWLPNYTQLKQIHSNLVFTADGRCGSLGEGDALVTNEPHNWIGIRTADCVPILIADPDHRAVATVHAGWRGTVASIATHTIDRLTREYGSEPRRLLVAIGPAIGPCCFEVGPEVALQFHSSSRTVDLPDENRKRLLDAGIPTERIDVIRLCTVCTGPGQFHSFRRDRDQSGRMVSAICIGDEKSAGR